MRPFFSKEETISLSRGRKGNSSCYKCGLYSTCTSPKMEPYGKFKKGIMIIGDWPSETSDERGKPWLGLSGVLLKNTLKSLGVDLYQDCISLNAVNCRPPNGRKPDLKEITFCRDIKVIPAIEKYKPYLIILLGTGAIQSFLAHRWHDGLHTIDKWRGWNIPDREFNTWVVPTFSPRYVDNADKKVVNVIWKQDLELAVSMLEESIPKLPKIKYKRLKSLKALDSIKSGTAAFDFETTGLKPQRKEQKILCGSIAYKRNEVYVFKMPRLHKNRMPFIRFLQNPDIRKVASNFMFEDNWCNVKLGTSVNGWDWDTMQAAHVDDNRPLISGLKFQAYVKFGVLDYSSEIKQYLKAKDSNSTNRLEEFMSTEEGLKTTLKYCGQDSIYEFWLAEEQMKKMTYDSLPF